MLLIKKFNEVKGVIMSEEEIRIAEMLHEEGKAIAGLVTIVGAFAFFAVVGLGYL